MLMDSYAKHQKLEPRRMNNGILCGLVSISGSAGLIEPHYAVIVGSVAGIVYPTASKILLHKFKVDDVVDAVPVHLGGGVWGLLAASLFTSSRAYLTKYDSYVDDGETPCGLFMGCANSGAILGSNFVFLLAQVSWVVVTCSIVLYVIKRQIGLRVNLDDEVKGLDQSQHGGRSYTEFQTTVFKFKTASGAEHSMEMRVRAGDAAKFAMALSEVMEGAAGGVADVGPDDSVKGAKISRVFINNQPVESESESDYGSSQHSKGSRGESLRAASVFAQMGIQPVPTSSSAGAGGDVVLNMPPSALKPVREEWRSSPDDSPSRDEAEMKKKKKRTRGRTVGGATASRSTRSRTLRTRCDTPRGPGVLSATFQHPNYQRLRRWGQVDLPPHLSLRTRCIKPRAVPAYYPRPSCIDVCVVYTIHSHLL